MTAGGQRPGYGSGGWGPPWRVLVVDDEADTVRYLFAVLSDAGYQVSTARGGEEALALAGDLRPDLVTLDAAMPGMSGQEVLGAMRSTRELARVPVVVLTGAKDARRSFDEAGGRPPEGFLVKPAEPWDVLDTVRRAIGAGSAT